MARKSSKISKSPTPLEVDAELDAGSSPFATNPSDSPQTLSDDGEYWEDEPALNLAHPHEKSPSPSPSAPRVALVRKRRGGKTVFVAQQNPNRRYPSARTKNRNIGEDAPSLVDSDKLRSAFSDGASFTVRYAFDVLKTALSLLRKPLGILLFVYLLSMLFSQVGGAFRTVLSPLCWIPGVSRMPLCSVPTNAPKIPKWADYPKLVDMQGSRFEQLLDESVGNSGISLDIKRAEMATSDLITLVRVSDFKSRDALADHLIRFVADAKRAGRGLQRLSSRIAGAVDNVIAVNDYALHTIEEHQHDSSALSILWPFTSQTAVQKVVRETFTDALSVVETQIRRIVLEAEMSLHDLLMLDEHLYTLSEFVARENGTLVQERAELLGALWTLVGGNKKKLRHMNGHLFLLSSIGEYRRRATAHVTAALQTLQGMSADMEDLRERVAAPELVGEKIPVEVHMKSIRAGLERLQADRERTKEREEETMRRILGIEAREDD